MKPSLRIVVADDEPDMRDYFKKGLTRLGHQVVAVAQTGRELPVRASAFDVDRTNLYVATNERPRILGLGLADFKQQSVRFVNDDSVVGKGTQQAMADGVRRQRARGDGQLWGRRNHGLD